MSIYPVSKRVFDFVVSIVSIIVLLPVFIVLVVLIRLGSRGEAVFRQERAGKGGKSFIFYKFRTMKLESDPFGPSPKGGEDPRLTKVGRFLREYSLDELPQLLNIVRGDMSLVGPRPLYLSQMSEWNEREKTRLLVRPGLTGLAQVSGRGSLNREQKLELDAQYVERACFALDFRIILATAGQTIGKQSIYEKSYSEKECTRGDADRQKDDDGAI